MRCDDDTEGLRVLINDEWPHTEGLGYSLNGEHDGIVLNFTFRNWPLSDNNMNACNASEAQRESCIRIIAVHEFGHALGFAHEQNREDAPLNCRIQHQGSQPTWYITPYDLDSVMNYCNPAWSGGGNLSSLDIEGLQIVYGPPGGAPGPSIANRGLIHVYERSDAEGVPFCTIAVTGNFLITDFSTDPKCRNDAGRSILLQNFASGDIILLYDNPQGNRNDDWLEIIVKAPLLDRLIPSLELSIEDDAIQTFYHTSDDDLDDALSRIDVLRIPSGPVVDLYDGGNATGSLECSILLGSLESPGQPHFLDFRQGECDDNAAQSMTLYGVPAGRTILLFDSAEGSRNDDWLEIVIKSDVFRRVIPSFERSFEDDELKVIYHGDGDLDKAVSRFELFAESGCPTASITEFNETNDDLFTILQQTNAAGYEGTIRGRLSQGEGALILYSQGNYRGESRLIGSHQGGRRIKIGDLGDWNDHADGFLFFAPDRRLLLRLWADRNFTDNHIEICGSSAVSEMDDETCGFGVCGNGTESLALELQ